VDATIARAAERRHAPGGEPLWGEAWSFDFAAPDRSLGGFVRLGLYPNLGVAWYWAFLVGPDRPVVAVRDHDVELPRTRSLEVRSEGLWSAVNCETPLEHWSVGLEAFAVALEDPLDAFRGERGERVAVGFDLEWEATGPALGDPPGWDRASGYAQPCRVDGLILLGAESIDFAGSGRRDHRWGVQDWWAEPRCRIAGQLSDGTTVQSASFETVTDEHGLPRSARVDGAERDLLVTPVALAAIALEGPDGRRSRLLRALCRLDSSAARSGVAWAEWLHTDG
jgi:hypothetical protein